MLLNKFPLQIGTTPIALSTDPMEIDDEYMDQITPVQTPTDQVTSPMLWGEPPKYGRTASVSSIASSVSNLSSSNNNDFSYSSFASHYKLTESFESILLETFSNYQLNPTITPFNEANPPAGILNRVSKDALKRAVDDDVEIGIELNNYSLTIIRQKLIQLCRINSGSAVVTAPNTRSNSVSSVSSLNNLPTINLSSKFANATSQVTTAQFEFNKSQNTDSYFNFELPPTPQQQQAPQSIQLQPSFLSEPSPTSATPPITRVDSNASEAQVLNLPEGLFNATSNRKRESLRLKRSGNKVTYS